MTTITPKHSWTEAERKELRVLWREGTTIPNIAKAMGLTYNQVEGQIGLMKKAGVLGGRSASPAGLLKPKHSSYKPEPLGYCPDAEARMLKAVNDVGGFPLQTQREINGVLVRILTTHDPKVLHPLQAALLNREAA